MVVWLLTMKTTPADFYNFKAYMLFIVLYIVFYGINEILRCLEKAIKNKKMLIFNVQRQMDSVYFNSIDWL